jgi:uncharacterized protein (TIGR03118 family)
LLDPGLNPGIQKKQKIGKNMKIQNLIITLATVSSISIAAYAAKENSAKSENRFAVENFVANNKKYSPTIEVDDKLINAWGIAIRPAGAGGHFWVTGKDISFEYVGDVRKSADANLKKLHADELKYVKLPVGGDENFATGVVFNDSKKDFTITQKIDGAEPITAPAKFIFASDGGIISAWTERKKSDGKFDRSNDAITVIDESKIGAQFFGLAISANYDRLYAADFGQNPTIKTYDGNFKPIAINFDMPFDENKNGKFDAGEYAPFNIQAFKTPEGKNSIFVAYAKTQTCPDEEVKKGSCKAGELFVGEEDTSKPGLGKLAEFNEDGKLIAIWNDGGKLSAPWGLAFAPENFGALANTLLVANFGDGTISGYDVKTKNFVDYVKDTKGNPIKIDKIWGLIFGNGESLGDKDALYFAAGPDDEKDGVFGAIRPAK